MLDFAAVTQAGLEYRPFLEKYGTPEHQRRWEQVHTAIDLSPEKQAVLAGFRREMKVLVVAGTWCGDCVQQCPIFDRFAAVNDKIRLWFFDRDAQPDLADELAVCGAKRVPAVLFMSEDNHTCGRFGDRTLSRYRRVAAQQLGGSCPTGIAPQEQEELNAVVQDWLNEFERIQLMLLTSARLRKLHGEL